MIAKIYIESAKNIRSEFLRLTKQLDTYDKEAAQLVIYLEEKSQKLKEFCDTDVAKIKNKMDVARVGGELIKEISEIEEREQQLLRSIKPINDKIDRLKKDEENLFNQIKEKYPNLTQKEIIQEIHTHL